MFEDLAWDKMNGLLPAIIQNSLSGDVLMLGYMNKAALEQTINSGKVTFYSRSKQKLWVKGETSGNTLFLTTIIPDCDNDALLILAKPEGPTCHKGSNSCFNSDTTFSLGLLTKLQQTIVQRAESTEPSSYTKQLLGSGRKRMAQKVGEEGVEVAIAASSGDRDELLNESADLIYHLLVLLYGFGYQLDNVLDILMQRMHAPENGD